MIRFAQVRRCALALCMTSLLFASTETCMASNEQAQVALPINAATEVGEEATKVTPYALQCGDFEYSEEIPFDVSFQHFVWELCEQYGVECSTVYGIMYHESRFKPEVVSATDDYGLMQINAVNHTWLSEELGRQLDFLDPYDNVEAGVHFLSKVRKETLVDTLMVYSLGETGAARARGRGVYQTRCVEELVHDIAHYREVLAGGDVD